MEYLRSHLTSKNTKIFMYKVLIRPVLTYASKTRILSKTNERRISLFVRKVLRCIFGAKQENETDEKDTIMNYMKHLMHEILLIT
jgi:hypothetical protein